MTYNIRADRGASHHEYLQRTSPPGVLQGKGRFAEDGELADPDLAAGNKIPAAVAAMRRAIQTIKNQEIPVSDCIGWLLIGNYLFLFLEGNMETVFKGVGTAIVTPMDAQGNVDYEAFARLIDWQVASGVNAIIVAGTTGEGSTLSDEEHCQHIKYCVDKVGGRIPVVAGTGSNDTDYAIHLTKFACEAGADAMLLVTPYYNKATQRGLIESFTAIADASTKPCILYNVPSRTGCNLLPKTALALSEHPMITGIKEASGNISQIAELMSLVQGKMDVYSGNDDQIVPILALGGAGVISVLSNVVPKQTVAICDSFFAGDIAKSRKLQLSLLPLINALFCEVNPIPVKAATAAMGYGQNKLRLPLTSMEKANEEHLLALMREAGVAFGG